MNPKATPSIAPSRVLFKRVQMSPIKLSDAAMDAVLAAAHPLPVERRGAFLEAAARTLASCGSELGPRLTHRIVAQVQKEFWRPPAINGSGKTSKYR
jgi:hypothetical protein